MSSEESFTGCEEKFLPVEWPDECEACFHISLVLSVVLMGLNDVNELLCCTWVSFAHELLIE